MGKPKRQKRREGGICLAEEKLLTVREVAERLRVNPETVRRWLRQGRLKGALMGGDRGGYRISENEVERVKKGGPSAA
jgi:excisionase family DNA binding protein